MSDCNLPSECDCDACNYWGENGWDMSRTPDWQKPKEDEPICGNTCSCETTCIGL